MGTGRNRIVRLAELADELGISRESIYRWERSGLIPRRRAFGPATAGWLRSDVDAWLESRGGTSEAPPNSAA